MHGQRSHVAGFSSDFSDLAPFTAALVFAAPRLAAAATSRAPSLLLVATLCPTSFAATAICFAPSLVASATTLASCLTVSPTTLASCDIVAPTSSAGYALRVGASSTPTAISSASKVFFICLPHAANRTGLRTSGGEPPSVLCRFPPRGAIPGIQLHPARSSVPLASTGRPGFPPAPVSSPACTRRRAAVFPAISDV